MNRIDRAAWKRIKARVAEPRSVTVFKGRSVGQTGGLLESEPQYLRELRFHSGHAIAFNKGRKGGNYRGTGRFSIDELFKDSDQVTPVIGHIAEEK
jgi:hypothetical protein